MAVKINSVEIKDAWVVEFTSRYIKLLKWQNQVPITPKDCVEAAVENSIFVVESITGFRYIAGYLSQDTDIKIEPLQNQVQFGQKIQLKVSFIGGGVAFATGADNLGNNFTITHPTTLTITPHTYDKYVAKFNACLGNFVDPDAHFYRQVKQITIEVPILPPSVSNRDFAKKIKVKINSCTKEQARFLYSLLGENITIIDDDGNTYIGKLTSVDLSFVADDLNPYKFPADIYKGTLEVML